MPCCSQNQGILGNRPAGDSIPSFCTPLRGVPGDDDGDGGDGGGSTGG